MRTSPVFYLIQVLMLISLYGNGQKPGFGLANLPCPGMKTIIDVRDGQEYPTVLIGDNCWMKKNLNYKVENSWCYNEFDSKCEVYGRLYEWETAIKVCPEGWHLPNLDEWQMLIEFLGGYEVAGSKLKEVGNEHWLALNTDATDSSGFSALPGGYMESIFLRKQGFKHFFFEEEENAYFWIFGYNGDAAYWKLYDKIGGTGWSQASNKTIKRYSVRCVRDQ